MMFNLDVCSMLYMLLTIFWQCAKLDISWVGLVRRDLAILARAAGGATS
jgi:hypothetical protein